MASLNHHLGRCMRTALDPDGNGPGTRVSIGLSDFWLLSEPPHAVC